MRIEWDRYRVCPAEVGAYQWQGGVRVAPGWAADPHTPDNDLLLVRGGRGRFRGPDKTWKPLRPGVFVWLRPGWAYGIEQEPDDPITGYFAHFELMDGRGRRRPWGAAWPPDWIEPVEGAFAEAVFQRVVHLCYGWGEHGMGKASSPVLAARTGAALQSLLMELDAETDPRDAAPVPPASQRFAASIRQAATRIVAAPRETYYVAGLARECGLSTPHFERLFKLLLGESPQKFVLRARLQRARQLLRDTDLSVGEVADAAGYSDIYFFSRQFKQLGGESPLQYRKKIRNDNPGNGRTPKAASGVVKDSASPVHP